MPKYVDRVGREVTVGSKVAFGTRKQNHAEVRTAEVVEIVDSRRGIFYLLLTEAGKKTSKDPKEVVVYG